MNEMVTGRSGGVLPKTLGHTLPANFFLDGLTVPKDTSGIRRMLIRDRNETEKFLESAQLNRYDRILSRVELYFYPCTTEVALVSKIISKMSYYYRCLAISRDWVKAVNAQVAAFSEQRFEVLSRPANSKPLFHLTIYTAGMDGDSFIIRLDELFGVVIPREPLAGTPFLWQMPLLILRFPSRPTIKAFAERLYFVLDRKFPSHILSRNQKTAWAKKNPELFIQMLLQIYNIGALVVYVPDGKHFTYEMGSRFIAFLVETAETIGVPVFMLGTPAVAEVASKLDGMSLTTLYDYAEVSSYHADDAKAVADGYLEELREGGINITDVDPILSIPTKMAYQRKLIKQAAIYVGAKMYEKVGNINKSKDYVEKFRQSNIDLIRVLEGCRGKVPVDSNDLAAYSEFLPIQSWRKSTSK